MPEKTLGFGVKPQALLHAVGSEISHLIHDRYLMAVFHVAFDFVMERMNPSYDYSELFVELKSMEHHSLSKNNWFIVAPDLTDESARELRDSLVNYIHKNDSVFVIPVSNWFAYASSQPQQWLHKHIPTANATIINS